MTSAWSFGGTTLATYGKVTLINDYLDIPERRGGNVLIPFRHGTTFVQKYYAERRMSFGIAVITASAAALETAMDNMRAKFAPLTQQVLSNTREDATVREAYATVDGVMDVDRFSDRVARVVVNFTLTSPYFRLNTAIADNTVTPNSNNFHFHVTNPGTVQETDPTIILTGLYTTSVTITNTTNGAILTYTGTIAATNTVTIGTLNGEFYCTHNIDGNVIGRISHSGAASLMPIEVGLNEMQIASAGQGGDTRVKVTFSAPYL